MEFLCAYFLIDIFLTEKKEDIKVQINPLFYSKDFKNQRPSFSSISKSISSESINLERK